ncbi:MAG: HEPN domain-containing protein [Pseudomonadota bacterium]
MGPDIKNPDFAECIKRKRIREFSQGTALVSKELQIAGRDSAEALESLGRSNYKWATIQAYYSMFHTARALLYKKNYREKSHYCLIIALRALYIEEGKLPVHFVEYLQNGKRLREDADYYEQWSEVGAEEMVNMAKEFLLTAHKILNS